MCTRGSCRHTDFLYAYGKEKGTSNRTQYRNGSNYAAPGPGAQRFEKTLWVSGSAKIRGKARVFRSCAFSFFEIMRTRNRST